MISVIIPCFNAANTITSQLEALANQQWSESWEVIVSDNGSTDSSVAVVEQYKARIPLLRVVDSSSKRGASHARNVGAKVAKGDALAFIDDDDEIAPGWLAAMGEALAKHDFVAGRLEYKKLNEPWVVKCHQSENDQGLFHTSYLPFAGTCNLGIKRSLHDAIGGFDETLLRHQDVDYCWRLQQAGTKLNYVPEALVHYRLRNTVAGMYQRAWITGESEARLYKKHRPLGMPQLLSWKTFVKASVILSLELLLLQVRSKESLARWLMHFAWRAGGLRGCIKYRYLPL